MSLDESQVRRLRRLQERRGVCLVLDVPLCAPPGSWPPGTADHRIDAVMLPGTPRVGLLHHDDADGFADWVQGGPAVLVASRGSIDRPLLGLLVAGTDLFSRSYPSHGRLSQLAVVDRADANMTWVYRYRGVEIEVADG